MNEATLLSGDLDYKPLVDLLVQEGMFVNLWYEKKSTTKELIYAADYSKPINYRDIYEFAEKKFQYALPSENFLHKMNRENRTELEKTKIIKTGKNENGEIITQKILRNKYFLIFPKDGNDYYLEHVDQDFLERIIRNTEHNFKSFRWDR
jgi:hypothetical protein